MLLLGFLALQSIQGQGNYWTDIPESRIVLPPGSEVAISASQYRTLDLDFGGLRAALAQAPMEFSSEAANPARISLPLPDGRFAEFEVVESPVMAPGLAARFPEIRSYQAYGLSGNRTSARFDYSPLGFHASIRTPEGTVYIEPYATNQQRRHISYYRRDMQMGASLPCGYDPAEETGAAVAEAEEQAIIAFRNNEPVPLRTYRLALACTGEYASLKGGTLPLVLASINTAVNLANQVFQLETSVRMQLIEENDQLIFLNAASDPYNNSNQGRELLGQNTAVINGIIGLDDYDIGHVFTGGCSDVGGVASPSSVCTLNKARGVTCHYTNNITAIVNQVLVHEVGHQFSCGHSWNNCPGSMDQLSPENAFEPGSGSTIMSYAGACGMENNIQNESDAYYNIGSLEDFIEFSRVGDGSGCGFETVPGNNQPEVTHGYQDGFFIPIRTPFELTAQGSDPDGDALTYCWEQYDLGPVSQLGSPSLDAPVFRSAPPVDSPTRVFPSLFKIVNNLSNNNEVLPTYNRNFTFRCTVRDNDPEAGGVAWAEVKFKADQTSGPFLVTAPNADTIAWKVGEYREVTWNVANTTNARVKCNFVHIKLSIDGGFTYPYTLAASTPNDGSAFVSVPDAVTADARVRIEAANNIFFDISDADFTIEPATEPGFAMEVLPADVPLYCSSEGSLTVDIQTASLLDYDSTITLGLAGNLPAGASYAFGQNSLAPGESTTLTIDLGGFAGRDTLELQILAEAPGLETASRNLYVIVLSSDFSALELLAPADGASDIVLSTSFSWTDIENATSYDFELATNPAFGQATIESASGLASVSYTPTVLFEENTLYFWRVRPVNECGPGEWLPPFGFHTTAVDCANTGANDLPINIANSPNTKISKIFIPTDGLISDLNLTNVEVTFQPVNSLRIFLVSPAGTEVRLWNLDCLNTGLIRVGFDDEAPTDIICPPDDNLPVRPDQPLSAFDGENTAGEWQLKVVVVTSGFGSGGTIKSWNLEFCAAVASTPPSLITNETLFVPPGQSNTITKDLLEVQDDVATPSQLRYTIVTPPAHGQLYRWSLSEPLGAGAHFTQATVNTFNLVYVHDGSDTQTDSFTFVAEDGEGGWLPTQVFNIEIDENATVSVKEAGISNGISLAPNPGREEVRISFRQPLSGSVSVHLLNLQGRQVLQRRFTDGSAQLELDISQLPAGAYFVQVHTEQGLFVEKLVVQR